MQSISVPVAESSTNCGSAVNVLERAIEVFDEIFIDVAPINLYNDPKFGTKTKIPARSLTDAQCDKVRLLGGFLADLKENLQTKQNADGLGLTQGKAASSQQIGDLETTKKFNLLKEYLVNELNRSEAAEHMLKAKENELVLVTAERDKLQKKLANISQYGGSSRGFTSVDSAPARTASVKSESGGSNRAEHAEPASLLGGFIRKPFGNSYFFGLIASYDASLSCFQIVYEDTDFEDLTYTELRRVLWSGTAPTAKREACLKHARSMGYITEEQSRSMATAQEAAAAAFSLCGSVKRATTSSSSSSSGTTITSSGASVGGQPAAIVGDGSNIDMVTSSGSGSSDTLSDTVSAMDAAEVPKVRQISATLAAATVSDGSSSGGGTDNDASRDSFQSEGMVAANAAVSQDTTRPAVESTSAVSVAVGKAAPRPSVSAPAPASAPAPMVGTASSAPAAPTASAASAVTAHSAPRLSAAAAVLASTTTKPKKGTSTSPSSTTHGSTTATMFKSWFQTEAPANPNPNPNPSRADGIVLKGSNLSRLANLSSAPSSSLGSVSASKKAAPPKLSKQRSTSQLSTVSTDSPKKSADLKKEKSQTAAKECVSTATETTQTAPAEAQRPAPPMEVVEVDGQWDNDVVYMGTSLPPSQGTGTGVSNTGTPVKRKVEALQGEGEAGVGESARKRKAASGAAPN